MRAGKARPGRARPAQTFTATKAKARLNTTRSRRRCSMLPPLACWSQRSKHLFYRMTGWPRHGWDPIITSGFVGSPGRARPTSFHDGRLILTALA